MRRKITIAIATLLFCLTPLLPGAESAVLDGVEFRWRVPANGGADGRIMVLFGGIKNARFKKQVRPGDVLELSCELIERRGPVGFGKAVAKVDGKVAAQGELTFAVGG